MSNWCKEIGEANHKQPAGTIFTEWKSAGIYGTENKNNISNYPLVSSNNLVDSNIVLNNNNNVRNNYQNHSIDFIDNSNTFNNLALNFSNNDCKLKNLN